MYQTEPAKLVDMESAIYLAILAFLPFIFFIISWNNKSSNNLPPGSLGLPLIGHTFQIVKALRSNKYEDWLQQRIQKYGPVSKLYFLGYPMVFLHGSAAHKFILTADETTLSHKQPTFYEMLIGKWNLLGLTGLDHKRWRAALVPFVNAEAVRRYIVQMDNYVQTHLKDYWHQKDEVLVTPVMNTFTFNMLCSLLFGIEKGRVREELEKLYGELMAGFVQIPINLPFTPFNKSLRTSDKIKSIIKKIIEEKRAKVEKGQVSEHADLITSVVSMRDESNSPLISDQEIMDNFVGLMIAGQFTTTILLTFFIKLLGENPHVYEIVAKEQEEIAKGKMPGEPLSWDDLTKMKYTWKAAQEAMRLHPPVTMNFRTVLKDIEIGGYTIPKGWKVMWTASFTHMDESIFPDPYKFNPSRHENQGTIPPYNFLPFGAGPRMCPGLEFARTEALTLIHYLVTGFQWKLSLTDNKFNRDPMPSFGQGLPIQVEAKKPPQDAN